MRGTKIKIKKKYSKHNRGISSELKVMGISRFLIKNLKIRTEGSGELISANSISFTWEYLRNEE